ncbi:receptor-like kinase TMK4 [Rutidosis leptorrhynchoides]|uniref:receptor-like kinase TMK4 n=1 Tax=Rutidosis leptorrhynchoides TaxID=125765 RepID=UPI003A9A36BC
MADHRSHLLRLTAILLHLFFTSADDATVMSKLSTSISPTPSTWQTTTNYCDWEGIACDNEKRVTVINIPEKSLTGTLPDDVNTLTQLKTLALQRNSLSGELPSLANLSLLEEVYLDGNNFTSISSGFFVGLTNLKSFSISDNLDLSPWTIPDNLLDSTNLKTFDASNANISGSIPDIFDNFPNLQDVRLSYNNLTGILPVSLGRSEVMNLWLNNQKQGLSGTLDVLANMTQLKQVWLQANAFTGAVPDLSQCTDLFDLQLRDNQLTGVLPRSLSSLPNLANITLQNNKLQGPLPVFGNSTKFELGLNTNSFCLSIPGDCDPQVSALLDVAGALGYPMSLAETWRGNNACEGGWDFVTCDSLGKNVTAVNFGKQKFSGTISRSLVNLTSLRTISLNENNLVGSIPDVLVSLPDLILIDVSNNNLSGPLPVFPPKVKFLHDNNPLLGQSIPSGSKNPPGSASNSSVADQSSLRRSKGSSSSVGMISGVVFSVLIFALIVMFVSYKCYMRNKYQKVGRIGSPETGKELVKESVIGSSSNAFIVHTELQSQSSGDHSEMPVFESGNVMISIQVLKQVTNNFSDKNVLGRGGFGVVYKGELHDGTMIAVKRMESGVKGTKGINEFQAEIGVLTKVRHRHLVALLGYCINDNERLLVYEYMPQGTLSQHLFNWRECKGHPLNWKQRVSIALDVGRGVEYLHSLAQQSFIHRDLKPSNILLGNDMRAKVADFGLVKNAPDGKYSVETKLAGTFGYLAPEYAATGRVTTKVDVFAFGVVLMELITGRKALDEDMPDERCHLVTWFRRVLIAKENIVKSIDQFLDTDDEETLESIFKVAELAGHCTAREPFQRPDMGHAVNVLGPLVEQWKPSKHEEEVEETYSHKLSLPEVLQRWQADEGTSRMFDMSFSETQSSIPSKPLGFSDTFDSTDCR